MAGDRWVKDPLDSAPYTFEWDDYLTTGETVTAASVTVAPGLTKLGEQIDANQKHVTFKVSGGVAGTWSAPNRVPVLCVITTSEGEIYAAKKYITIQEREV